MYINKNNNNNNDNTNSDNNNNNTKGAVWTEVETGLWDEHEDQFVAGVGF